MIPAGDIAALIVFCLFWLGYPAMVRALGPRAINNGLLRLRGLWMRSMLGRDNRIVDASLVGHVMHSTSFFASASLIAIGALFSVLGAADRVQPLVESINLVAPAGRALFELRIMLPLAVLLTGFVNLTWAIRQLNYSIALIGAAPAAPQVGPRLEALADAIGGVMSAGLATFNAGIRAYYFALAGLAWLAGPVPLVVAGAAIAAMLVWRQALSPASREFQQALAMMEHVHDAPGG